jgi:tripartite-type tricarboxylate transporter receptor subunit TctC
MTRLMAWFAAFSCILLLVPSHAAAEFPERPIRLIVPFAAGGAMDIMARDIGSVLAERLKQTVTVENVTAGGPWLAASEWFLPCRTVTHCCSRAAPSRST